MARSAAARKAARIRRRNRRVVKAGNLLRQVKPGRMSNARAKMQRGIRAIGRSRINARNYLMNYQQSLAPGPRKRGGPSALFPTGKDSRATSRVVTVSEDEYITDVFGSTGFATTAYLFNPGQRSVFPWGSQVAGLFEKWTTARAQFYYKPLVSAFATNGQAGKIMLSFDYDASDLAPLSKQQVEATVPHADCMPYQTCSVNLNPRQLNGQDSKYVRPGAQPSNTDIKTYDGGVLYVSTAGNAATTVIGELRVRYTFHFHVPILEAPFGIGLLQAHIVESPAASAAAAGNAFLGTSGGVLRSGSTLNSVCTGNTFTLPTVGNYIVAAVFNGSVTATATFTPGSNITGVTLFVDSTTSSETVANGSSQTSWTGVYSVSAAGTSAANTVTISGLTALASGKADIFISQISTGLLSPLLESPLKDEKYDQLYNMIMSLKSDRFDRRVVEEDDDLVSIVSSSGARRMVPSRLVNNRSSSFAVDRI